MFVLRMLIDPEISDPETIILQPKMDYAFPYEEVVENNSKYLCLIKMLIGSKIPNKKYVINKV